MCNFDNYSHEYKTRRIFALWVKSCYWGVGVLLVNCYVSYKTFIESRKLKPISHYEFHKAIALALIDPEQYWPDRMTKKTQQQNSAITDDTCVIVARWWSDSMTNTSTRSAKK